MAVSAEMRPIQILLVEDNPGDVILTKKAMLRAKLANELHVATDGEQALGFLRNQVPFVDSPRPDLILLDINLPKKNGHEVLAEIKQDADLRAIPVVVLTGSDSDADVKAAYNEHANSYITKVPEIDHFAKIVASIDTYWFAIVTRPAL